MWLATKHIQAIDKPPLGIEQILQQHLAPAATRVNWHVPLKAKPSRAEQAGVGGKS